jgi:hypothetical protein
VVLPSASQKIPGWSLYYDTIAKYQILSISLCFRHYTIDTGRHVVAQLFEALRYAPQGLRSWCRWKFHRRNLTGRTVALGSTRLLTEMSTRNISCGVKPAGTWNLEIWKPQPPGTLRSVHGLLYLRNHRRCVANHRAVLSSHCCQNSVKIWMCRFGRSLSYRHYVSWDFVQWFWCFYMRTYGHTGVVELMSPFCRLKFRVHQ